MIYDDYLDLSKFDLVPFVSADDSDKAVNRVIYKVKGRQKCYLDMWINCEKTAFYLYMMLYILEGTGFGIGVEFIDMKKVKLSEKYGRGTREKYYSAGMKAAIFGKAIINKTFENEMIDWNPYRVFPKAMRKNPFLNRYSAICDEETFYFDEEYIGEE